MQPAADLAGGVGELLPVGAADLGPHQVQTAALDGDGQLVEQPDVVDEPAAHAAAAHLPVRVREQDGRRGDADREVVEDGDEVLGHGSTLGEPGSPRGEPPC